MGGAIQNGKKIEFETVPVEMTEMVLFFQGVPILTIQDPKTSIITL